LPGVKVEIVICGRCGYVLHRGEELVTPRDVVKKYNGRCPRCSSQLSTKSMKIEVVSKGRRSPL